jgi:hypothetical protein
MRLSVWAMLAASLACLGGCGRPGGRAADRCPALPASQPPLGSAKLVVYDVIGNLAPPGSPLALRPQWRSDNPKDPGVCIDAATGDIHLYGSKTRRVTFVFSFDKTLSLSAIWPVDPKYAVLSAARPGATWTRSTFSPAFVPGHQLVFTVPYEPGREPYPYRLQYTDPNDPEDTPHGFQALIINH